MDGPLDEKNVLDDIRRKLARALGDAPLPPVPAHRPEAAIVSDGGPRAELDELAATQDICNVPLRSYRTFAGRAVTLARKLTARLLAPELERQVSYNAANLRIVSALIGQIEALRNEQRAMRDALEAELLRLRRGGASGQDER
jgi:hypothetical protein